VWGISNYGVRHTLLLHPFQGRKKVSSEFKEESVEPTEWEDLGERKKIVVRGLAARGSALSKSRLEKGG